MRTIRNEYVDRLAYEISGKRRDVFQGARCQTKFDNDIAVLDVTKFPEPRAKRIEQQRRFAGGRRDDTDSENRRRRLGDSAPQQGARRGPE